MKIAGYVGDLLYDYECVVIPGLGGFITSDKSAQVVAVTHHFKPPFREVHFNIHLKANDGLLINYVAHQEELSYREAKNRVDQFSFQCLRALDNGKRIRFHGIGSLAHDHEKNIVFTQDKTVNYNAQAFGLESFVSPAIARTSDEEKVLGAIKKAIPEKKATQETKTQPVRRKKPMLATRKRSTFAKQFIFLMAVFFLMGVGYVYMHRHAMGYYAERYATRVPFFYTDAPVYFATNIDLIPFGKMTYYTSIWFPGLFNEAQTPSKDESQIPEVIQAALIPMQSPNTVQKDELRTTTYEEKFEEPTTVVIETETPKENVEILENPVSKPVVTQPREIPSAKTSARNFAYFVIAGAFNNETNALNLVQQLRKEGFDAMIADTNKYGMFRVAYKGFHSAEEAANALAVIKDQSNPQAWILKK